MVRKSALGIVATILLAAGMVASSASLQGAAAQAFSDKPIVDDPDGKLLATEYYSLAPFVIPIIDGKVHKRELTLVLAIGLFDDRDRVQIKYLVPKFRDSIYQLLFNLISFRTANPRIPGKSVLERKLFPLIKKLGGEIIKSVKVHKMILGNKP